MLWSTIRPVAPALGNITENDITFDSPVDLTGNKPQLSLFLFQVTENPFTKNQDLLAGSTPGVLRFPPLALTLFYVVTPFARNREIEHLLLGRVMQAFYDHAVLDTSAFADPGWSVPSELHIALASLSLEDLNRIWMALNQSKGYKLSVAYHVTPVPIDSGRELERERVVFKETHYRNFDRVRGAKP
jgi:uncharacterized protein DUF4255